jgi:hypothetical protein
MHYTLNLSINEDELWANEYETDFSEDQQKTDELRNREEASFFAKETS